MNSNCIETAVMFADIAGSSQLYHSLGDQRANEVVEDAIKKMAHITCEHDGVVIKTIGDEIMAQFDCCLSACRAAIALQSQLQQSQPPLQLRIGMAWGSAITRGGDLFGQVVNDAAAVARIARGLQILLTEPLHRQLAGEPEFETKPFDHICLKGSNTESTIFRIDWQSRHRQHATRIFNISAKTAQQQRLVLRYRDQEICVGSDETPYYIGRDPEQSQLAVHCLFASRQHLQIVFRRGKFVLIDQSTNGTYIKTDHHNEIYLRREELPLNHHGVISLGESTRNQNEHRLEFRTESIDEPAR